MKIPKQISLRTALIIILISVIVTSGLFYVFGATPTTTFTISPGVYPGAPSYTIWKEGSNYFAKDSNGLIEYSGSNASQITLNAINQLSGTTKEAILFKGAITFTHSISLKSYTVIQIQGKLSLANSANCDMFKLIDCIECEIHGGVIDGNKANNAAGIGINITQVGAYVADQAHIIEDILIQNFAGDGLVILGDTRECRLVNVYSGGNDGRGFQFAGGDHKLLNLVAGNNKKYGFDFSSGGNTQGTNLKAFGSGYGGGLESEAIGIQIGSAEGIYLSNVQVQDNYKHGIYIANTENHTLTHVIALDNSLNFSGGAGIIIENSARITISDILAINQKDTQTQDYGIFLHTTNNYTIISTAQAFHNNMTDIFCDYDALNTRIVDSWNGTTWISEYP